ncbi:Uncharacterized conserved protein [Haloarcula vallismortis]|uniref:DUF2249 domain-containing protein n=2 Tax=Haloarcula vallismortis TaxID=28442 RepID=M0IYB3_HALVA|nr:DUF2249 domain-containing protein [Haloarcula vallismortis]EMA01038.1 hypothetical protein C437_19627 [Haloarcula vallismortis ATCC 29715]SDW13546.1 Uncharacterized conserved protein [Haloarcula vallismortis]
MSTDSQQSVQELDVREADGEPFEQIMSALGDIDESEALRLVNSFEPVPLYDVLSKKGYQYDTEQVADEEWHVTIRPE